MKMAQVGVSTRSGRSALTISPAPTSPSPSPKRRKINNNSYNTSHDLKFSPSSSVDQFKSISNGSPETVSTTVQERCSGPASSLPSCCSSNGSFGIHQERMIKFIDPEVDSSQVETSTCNCGDQLRRDQMSFSSEVRMKSQEEKPTMQANSRRVVLMPKKMPMDLELEEFFTTAEKDIKIRFSEKYNYDIVKDVPLEGRYEWVQLKP